MNHLHHSRTAVAVTLSVWKALFLREALSRLFASRGAWFWLLAEPVFHTAYLMFIFVVIRVGNVGGIDVALWIMVGMQGFFMFRNTGTQVMNAIGANRALFAYRQVKPIDTLLVRAGLEGLILIFVTGILMAGLALWGHSIWPEDPLSVFEAFLGLWLFGLGFGLITSVIAELVPEFGKIINLIMMTLMILSGVMLPLTIVPQPYRDWLMLNPVAHGLETARLGFVPHYHSVEELNMAYLFGSALVCIFLGLVLHRRYALRLISQ